MDPGHSHFRSRSARMRAVWAGSFLSTSRTARQVAKCSSSRLVRQDLTNVPPHRAAQTEQVRDAELLRTYIEPRTHPLWPPPQYPNTNVRIGQATQHLGRVAFLRGRLISFPQILTKSRKGAILRCICRCGAVINEPKAG